MRPVLALPLSGGWEITLRSLPIHHIQQPSVINVQLDATSSAREIKSNSELMRIGHWNSRSMKTKVVYVCDLIVQNQLDVLVITESWLTGDNYDNLVIGDINTTLPNYGMFHLPRPTRGGRLGIIDNTGDLTASHEFFSFTVSSIFNPNFNT